MRSCGRDPSRAAPSSCALGRFTRIAEKALIGVFGNAGVRLIRLATAPLLRPRFFRTWGPECGSRSVVLNMGQ